MKQRCSSIRRLSQGTAAMKTSRPALRKLYADARLKAIGLALEGVFGRLPPPGQ